MTNEHTFEQLKVAGDVASVTTILGTLAGVLPVIAAFFATVYTIIRIYETKTFQKFLNSRRKK